jgi:hypothetical protein
VVVADLKALEVPAVNPLAVPLIFVPTKVEGVPKLGFIRVGESFMTTNPVPVSLEITPANWAEVVAAN